MPSKGWTKSDSLNPKVLLLLGGFSRSTEYFHFPSVVYFLLASDSCVCFLCEEIFFFMESSKTELKGDLVLWSHS